MLATYLLNNLFQAISAWLMAGVSQRALKAMRTDLFGHLQTLPLGFFDRNPAGELMSRLTNDIEAINQAVSQNVTSLLASVLSMVGILIAMFVLDKWLALASLLVVPIMFWFTQFVARYTRRGFRELQKHLGELNATMEESISGQKVITAFRRNESAVAAFRERNEAVFRAGVSANSYALLLMPLTNVLGNFFVIVLAGLGGFLALRGLVTVGIIATFISLRPELHQPASPDSRTCTTRSRPRWPAPSASSRCIDTPSEVDATAGSARRCRRSAATSASSTSTSATGPTSPCIKDMSLHAQARPDDRARRADGRGQDDDHQPADALLRDRRRAASRSTAATSATSARQICAGSSGWCCRTHSCFRPRVMDNIRYGRLDATDDEVIAAAEMADADHFIRQLPQGYQTVLSERASNLSQGQRQLLAIARAILADPAILILDEATSSVDTRTEARIQARAAAADGRPHQLRHRAPAEHDPRTPTGCW